MKVIHLSFVLFLALAHADDKLQYECRPGNSSDVQIIIGKHANKINGNIFIRTEGIEFESKSDEFILRNCQPDTEITIVATRPSGDHVLKSSDVSMYTLECHWNMSPFPKTVTAASFSIATSPSPSSKTVHNVMTKSPYPWDPKLVMKITPKDKNKILIGTDLTLTITSSVKNKIKFSAETCTAHSTNYQHVLWNATDCGADELELFKNQNWTRDDNQDSISHPLKAFRFTDEATVKVWCQVRICPIGQESECDLDCQTPATTPATTKLAATTTTATTKTATTKTTTVSGGKRKRKRRDVTGRKTTVTASFTVDDLLKQSSSAAPELPFVQPFMKVFAFLCVFLHVQFL